MVKQSLANESDINTIMSRWVAHGQLPRGNQQPPTYGDFSSGLDFLESLNAVHRAQDEFNKLPAHIREHCRNDPGEFLEMVYDPERRDELIELGLVEDAIPDGAKPVPPAPPQEPDPAS